MKTPTDSMPVYGTPGASPDVPALIGQFKRCTPWSSTGWNRVRSNDDVRFARWPGQAADCKKHGSTGAAAFPWQGASDQRVFEADDVINTDVAECWEGFFRAWVSPKAGLSEVHGYAVKLAEYIVNVWLDEELSREVELSANYRQHYGWVVLHPCWETEVALEYRPVELEDLVSGAAQIAELLEGPERAAVLQAYPGAEGMAALPQLILDPEQADLAAQYLQMAWEVYSRDKAGRDLNLPQLKLKYLKAAVAELRATGHAELPVPYVCKDKPGCYALKPYEEIFLPPYCTDIQTASVVFQRDFLTEIQIRAKILTDGWGEAWVEEAVKHKGKISSWLHTSQSQSGYPPNTVAEGMSGTGTEYFTEQDAHTDLIEVLYATYRMLDENNVPGVYLTVLHPAVGAQAGAVSKATNHGWHGLMGNSRGRYPYVAGMRENWARAITSSRGIPEIVNSPQRVMKANTDATIDWTSIAVNPPRHIISGMKTQYLFGPGAENVVQQGREPKFADIPVKGVPLAYELLDFCERRVDRYFGRDRADLPPGHGQPKRQMKVSSFLLLWAAAVQGMIDQAQVNMSDENFAEVTGAPPGWLDGNRQDRGLLSAKLQFDVRELDPEYVSAMLKAVNEAIIPQDVAGITDRAKWTRAQWRMINPRLGRELVVEQGSASQAMFKTVKDDMVQMFAGNEAEYVQMDPSAKAKLGFAQQIVGANPFYQQALQDPQSRFAQLLEKYVKNLSMSVKQERNKVVGRIGVEPAEQGRVA